ncbi:hypothetical protein [Sagittula sp. NFXS13]|uniref:hypothetical protein n=1 Tax=Sagittula sp. NFXS13 TaxID=2819095 RepID=UPI0032DEEA38
MTQIAYFAWPASCRVTRRGFAPVVRITEHFCCDLYAVSLCNSQNCGKVAGWYRFFYYPPIDRDGCNHALIGQLLAAPNGADDLTNRIHDAKMTNLVIRSIGKISYCPATKASGHIRHVSET